MASAAYNVPAIDLTIALDSIRPDSGQVGDTLRIYGDNFGATQGSSTIAMGDSAPTVTSWNDTLIKFITPHLDTGRYDFVVSDGVTADTILNWHLYQARRVTNWSLAAKVRRKSFNHIAYVVDPIFASRADSSRHLFRGSVSSAAIHAKSYHVGTAAGDTARYTISATQLNECGTSGLWQFKFLASDLNITDSIFRYWPYGTNIDTTIVNELRLH
jgi:hypothetical protein